MIHQCLSDVDAMRRSSNGALLSGGVEDTKHSQNKNKAKMHPSLTQHKSRILQSIILPVPWNVSYPRTVASNTFPSVMYSTQDVVIYVRRGVHLSRSFGGRVNRFYVGHLSQPSSFSMEFLRSKKRQ